LETLKVPLILPRNFGFLCYMKMASSGRKMLS